MDFLTQDIIHLFPTDPKVWDSYTERLGQFAVSLVVAAIILVVTIWLSRSFSKLVKKGFARIHPAGDTDTTLANFISSLVRYAVLIVGLIAVLAQLGVQTTSILAVLGAASIAIGLALQGTLSNVAAGVMLLILRPYRVGDYVELAGRNGTVLALDLFITRLDSVEGLRLTIPNGQIISEVMVNYTTSGHRRVELQFGIDYDDDVDKALGVLHRSCSENPLVLETPAPWIKTTSLNDSTVTITLRFWVESHDYPDAGPDMLKACKAALEGAGIHFPYPHQVGLTRAQFKGLVPLDHDAAQPAPEPSKKSGS